jgi:gluconate 2-dehydrogenase alpha chain
MPTKLPATDVVVIGLGWAGSILSQELTEAGLNVVALERGGWQDTAESANIASAQDELRYVQRQQLMVQTAQTTITFRNRIDQTALPVRQWGAFRPGNGVGGAGWHWAGVTWRFLPDEFRMRSRVTERYGAAQIPDYMTLEDWGVTYDEMEPYYDRFEYLSGISGKAGNLDGVIQDGGNPFEGPRKREYPTPPLQQTYLPALFAEGARKLGYKPFPLPSGNLSQAYTNPLGVTLGPCTFCGACQNFGCANYSKASPQTTILPVLLKKPNFTVRTNSEVLRILLDSDGKRATGVVYADTSGQLWEQPADLVIVTAFILENVRLMLLSGIGKPYDPRSGEGVVGRNFSHQTSSNAQLFFDDKRINPFIAAGSMGIGIDEFNADNFDHAGLGFLGGANIRVNPNSGSPIGYRPTPPGTPRWGSEWKKAAADTYQRFAQVGASGSYYPSRTNYLDLDPTYKDRFGRPLLRLTNDFSANDLKMSAFVTARAAEIGHAMGAKQVIANPRKGPYSIATYQTTHINGGVTMGANPRMSVVNPYLQSWDVHNVFVVGSSNFQHNPSYNPTGTVGALAYRVADALRSRYLKNPGPLVPA